MNLARSLGRAARRFTVSRSIAALATSAMLAALLLAFTLNRDCLLIGLDGTNWIINLDIQGEFRQAFTQFGVDPVQGNFDAYFPAFREYLAPNMLAMLAGSATAGKTATYVVYASFLIAAIFLFARRAGVPAGPALLAGMVFVALSLPVFMGQLPRIYPILGLNPHMTQAMSLTLLILACLWSLDIRRPLTSLAMVVAAAVLVIWCALGQVSITVLMVPPIAAYGLASLFAVQDRANRILRVAAGLLLAITPVALGMLSYIYALSAYTAYNFFSNEFIQVRSNTQFASIIYQGNAGLLLVGFGLLGATMAVASDNRRLRTFGVAHLVSTAIFQITAFVVATQFDNYHGPSPLYFEIFFWPFSAIFAAFALFGIAGILLPPFERFLPDLGSSAGKLAASAVMLSVPALIAAWYATSPLRSVPLKCNFASFSPLRSTVIVDKLQQSIAAEPGGSFRGLAATFTGMRDKAAVTWLDLHAFDYSLWQRTGNDHRTVGLWLFRIPTLFQYSTYISPIYYLMLTEFLARPADQQIRGALVLTKPDERMLALWGVRYVIASDTQAVDGDVRAELPIQNEDSLRLLELRRPNLGDYSPTDVRVAPDIPAALRIMKSNDFDGRRTVLLHEPVHESLTPATSARFMDTGRGLRVVANSPGFSILALPVQYSHCWRVRAANDVRLLRANVMQLAVQFRGQLDVDIDFRFGPIQGGSCRLEDLRDMGRLRIDAARQLR